MQQSAARGMQPIRLWWMRLIAVSLVFAAASFAQETWGSIRGSITDASGAGVPNAKVELSGGITLENVRAYAETGADFVSTGAITHSAPAVDISFRLEVV